MLLKKTHLLDSMKYHRPNTTPFRNHYVLPLLVHHFQLFLFPCLFSHSLLHEHINPLSIYFSDLNTKYFRNVRSAIPFYTVRKAYCLSDKYSSCCFISAHESLRRPCTLSCGSPFRNSQLTLCKPGFSHYGFLIAQETYIEHSTV